MNDDSAEVNRSNNRYFKFYTLNRYEITLFIFGLLGLLMLFSIAIVSIYKGWNIEEIIFPIIIIISTLCSLIFLIRGIFEERPYELLVFVISATCIMFYVIIEFAQNFDSHNALLSYINVGVAVVIIPIIVILGTLNAYNYNIRGNLIYRIIEGLERLQDDCKNILVFEALVQLDAQLELSVIVLVLGISVNFTVLQQLILIIGIPFSILWHIGGFISIKNELKPCGVIFLCLGLLGPAYVIYIIWNAIHSIINAISEPILNPVIPVVSITFALCFLSIIIRIILLIICIKVCRKFGNGLKERLTYLCCDRNVSGERERLLNSPQSLA